MKLSNVYKTNLFLIPLPGTSSFSGWFNGRSQNSLCKGRTSLRHDRNCPRLKTFPTDSKYSSAVLERELSIMYIVQFQTVLN